MEAEAAVAEYYGEDVDADGVGEGRRQRLCVDLVDFNRESQVIFVLRN